MNDTFNEADTPIILARPEPTTNTKPVGLETLDKPALIELCRIRKAQEVESMNIVRFLFPACAVGWVLFVVAVIGWVAK